jgi:hypothetical protein
MPHAAMHRLLPVLLLAAWLGLLLPQACRAEQPLPTSVCDVLKNPAAYNHKLIQVSGLVSRGFEDFSLSDAKCGAEGDGIWLELGGAKGSQVMYCCGVSADAERGRPLAVEGIETTLVQNGIFDRFQRLTLLSKGYGRVRVSLIGRYFSGKEEALPKGSRWMGYGHMGFYTLLVIQEILVAEPVETAADKDGRAKAWRPSRQ